MMLLPEDVVETNSDDMDFVSGKGCPSIESTWPGGYIYTMYKTQRRSSKWQRHYLWNLLTSAAFQFKLTGWGEKKIEKAVAHLWMHTITLFIQEIRAAIAEKKYWCYHDLSLMTVCTFGWKKSLTIFFVCISFFCSCLYLPLQETPGFTLHLFLLSACSFSYSPSSLLICCRSSLLSQSVFFCLLLRSFFLLELLLLLLEKITSHEVTHLRLDFFLSNTHNTQTNPVTMLWMCIKV